MTVLVRPVPKRAGSNGIRPFVRPPVNNIRPYTIKNWRPPVPEPLPPAPLLGPKELLGLGLLVLAQIWGLLNKEQKATYTPAPTTGVSVLAPVQGTYDPVGQNTVTRGSYRGRRKTDLGNGTCSTSSTRSSYNPQANTVSGGLRELRVAVGPDWLCGKANTGFFAINAAGGQTSFGGLVAGNGQSGWVDMDFDGWSVAPVNPNAAGIKSAAGLMPWAGTTDAPARDAVPESVPQLPPLITPIVPAAPPAVEPETEPSRVPVEPGPSRPPTTTPLPPVFRPIRPVSPTGTKDGAIVPKPADPVVVTDPDWHFPIPGKGPIVGNGPRPTPEEMAKELGRLEQKLNSILNPTPDTPMEWQKWLEQIREALFNLVNGKTYTLTEDCNPDNDPNYTPRSWDFQAAGALNAFGVIENRLDALAAMIDQSLRAKQQVCLPTRPRPQGQLVTARFRSMAPSPNSSRPLRKELRYRDNAGRPEADHVAHWLGFEWQAGPAIVRSRGAAWGEVCVWAADPAEGRRVIAHAAAIAGVDLTVPEHRWFDQVARDSRTGQPGLMKVEHDQAGTPCISKRIGPSGTPGWMRDP